MRPWRCVVGALIVTEPRPCADASSCVIGAWAAATDVAVVTSNRATAASAIRIAASLVSSAPSRA